jgi:hypothetical protein
MMMVMPLTVAMPKLIMITDADAYSHVAYDDVDDDGEGMTAMMTTMVMMRTMMMMMMMVILILIIVAKPMLRFCVDDSTFFQTCLKKGHHMVTFFQTRLKKCRVVHHIGEHPQRYINPWPSWLSLFRVFYCFSPIA